MQDKPTPPPADRTLAVLDEHLEIEFAERPHVAAFVRNLVKETIAAALTEKDRELEAARAKTGTDWFHEWNESYPEGWKHAIIHLNPKTGEIHSDGEHGVRYYIENKVKEAQTRAEQAEARVGKQETELAELRELASKQWDVGLTKAKRVQAKLEADAARVGELEAARITHWNAAPHPCCDCRYCDLFRKWRDEHTKVEVLREAISHRNDRIVELQQDVSDQRTKAERARAQGRQEVAERFEHFRDRHDPLGGCMSSCLRCQIEEEIAAMRQALQAATTGREEE